MAGIENRMMGIGCFAGQRTLARVLGRLMKAYSLGDWTDALHKDEGASADCLALRKLISESHDREEQGANGSEGEKIAGFFLTYENRCLRLSVFLRRQGMRYRKYSAPLDELTCLRRSRLN